MINNSLGEEVYGPRPTLMSMEEVAYELGLSVGTLRNWRLKGDHPLMNDKAIRPGGRALRWHRDDVDEYVNGLRNKANTNDSNN